jgi:hypothetical protein
LYSTQSTVIEADDIKRINNIVYKFIWNIPIESTRVAGKISREKLQTNKMNGGLKAPDFKIINEAIKYKHILRLISSTYPIKVLTYDLLQKYNINFEDIHIINVTNSRFVNECINVHNKMYKCLDKDIKEISSERDSKPHIEYLRTLANHKLINCEHINLRQRYLLQNLRRNNVTKIGHLKQMQDRNDNRFMLERFQIWNSLPIEWRKIIRNSNRFTTYLDPDWDLRERLVASGMNKWKKAMDISTKVIYNRLLSLQEKKTTIDSLNTKFTN